MTTQAEHEAASHGPFVRCRLCPETLAHQEQLRAVAYQLKLKPGHGMSLLVSLFMWAGIILLVNWLI